MVWCPSLQPRLRRGGKQLHAPQQLLVWSRFPNATRYNIAHNCLLDRNSNNLTPFSFITWLLLSASLTDKLRESHPVTVSWDAYLSRTTAELWLAWQMMAVVTCCFLKNKNKVVPGFCKRLVRKKGKQCSVYFPVTQWLALPKSSLSVETQRVSWGTCLTNASCQPRQGWLVLRFQLGMTYWKWPRVENPCVWLKLPYYQQIISTKSQRGAKIWIKVATPVQTNPNLFPFSGAP